MKIFLYLLLSLAPIAVAYTKAFDGSRIKEPLIVVSYLSIMLWAVLFSTITHSLTGVEIKYSIAVFALVMGYGHFRLVQFLAKHRRNKQ
jgi:prepilin signal peptidase PulO-like enzyme (type II secretory pathway)